LLLVGSGSSSGSIWSSNLVLGFTPAAGFRWGDVGCGILGDGAHGRILSGGFQCVFLGLLLV